MIDKIITGEVCQYCMRYTVKEPGRFGYMLKCYPCNAWVSADKTTGLGLGPVAKENIRIKRKELQGLIKECLAKRYFTQEGIERLIYWRGRCQTSNIYHLSITGLCNVVAPLLNLIDEKKHRPFKSVHSIKIDLHLNEYK